MKRFFVFISISIIVALGIGQVGKKSFQNKGIVSINSIEDIRYLDCNVNQIFTSEDVDYFIEDYSNGYLSEAANGLNVMIVKPTNVIHQYNFLMTQEVEIIEVLNGNANKGSIVEIVKSGGVYDQKYKYHTYDNDRPLYYGLTNLMFENNYYLVLTEPLQINEYLEEKKYRLAFSVFSVFNLSIDYSKAIDKPIEEIAYNDYKDSEFLCDSEETADKLILFKHEVLNEILTEEQRAKYVID